MSKFVKFFALINACLSSLLAVSEISGLQHRQYRASEHRAEHSEILQDTGVYSTNRTSNIVRLFAKLVYWHRFHTRAPRVSPVTSFKLSSIAGLQLSLYVAVLLSLMYVVNPVRIGDGGNSGSTWNRVSLGHLGSNWVTSGQILNDLNLSFSYIS